MIMKIYKRRNMKQFCIVIPIYKTELDEIDKLSLKRLDTVIGKKYDIYLVKPNSLKCKNYYKYLNKKCVTELSFDDHFFENTASYSQLCLSYDFYNSFSDYEYMYIYQTDCYLVEDKLEEWCNKGYDYVGAPIIASDASWKNFKNPNIYEPQVGNGGFSLRKIEIFKDITNPDGEFRQYYKLTDELLSKVIYEDKYFCNDLYQYYDLVKPNWEEALLFGIDMNADVIYEKLNMPVLPMGIHAWSKNIRYWKTVLPELKDNKKVSDLCEERYADYFKLYYGENDSTTKPHNDEASITTNLYHTE